MHTSTKTSKMQQTTHDITQINLIKNQKQRFELILHTSKNKWKYEHIYIIIENLYYKEFNFIHENNHLTENIIEILQILPQKEQELLIIELAKKAANTLSKSSRERIIKTIRSAIKNKKFSYIESEIINNYKTTFKIVEDNSFIESYLDAYLLLISLEPCNEIFLKIVNDLLNKISPSKFSNFIDFILITIPELIQVIEKNTPQINKLNPSLSNNLHYTFLRDYNTISNKEEIAIDLFLKIDTILIKKLSNKTIYNCLENLFKRPMNHSMENHNIYLFSLNQNHQTYVFQQGLKLSAQYADIKTIEILKKLTLSHEKDIKNKAQKSIEKILKRHQSHVIGSLELTETTSAGALEIHNPGALSMIKPMTNHPTKTS
jgi:hypothetical protein